MDWGLPPIDWQQGADSIFAMSKRTVKGSASAGGEPPRIASMLESYLPAGSRERTAAKIAAAAGGALIAAAVLGVGPAALAGAAGYLVYRETHR